MVEIAAPIVISNISHEKQSKRFQKCKKTKFAANSFCQAGTTSATDLRPDEHRENFIGDRLNMAPLLLFIDLFCL